MATLAEVVLDLKRRAAEAEEVHATAPVADVYRSVLVSLQPLLQVNGSKPHGGLHEEGRQLTATEVATRLQVPVRYVYRHAAQWPFARRVSRKVLRFDEAGLLRWLERRG